MIQVIDMSHKENLAKILALQYAAYEKEAEWIGTTELPPLKDTIETLRSCGEIFFGYYEKGELLGAISFKRGRDVIDIHRLMVHPSHFRKGIAGKLLDHIVHKEKHAKLITVTTGADNIPAICFYEQAGFEKAGEFQTREQIRMSSFIKKLL